MLVLALIMVLGTMNLSVFAESEKEYTPTDVYVLNYSTDNEIEGYKDWDAKRFYFSPYRTNIWVTIDEETGELENWNWCTASIMNMINMSAIDKTKEATEPYASTMVYCVDAITDGVVGYEYRRINLEDASYFDDETAGRLRAIMMNSFPHITDMSEIETAVNAWITDNNLSDTYSKVESLNHYEVISATQSVIWTITNNGKLASNAYAGYNGYGSKYYTKTWYEEECLFGIDDYLSASEYTENNINAVARYLEALAPMAAQSTIVTEASFSDAEIFLEKEQDGTYTATVTVNVTADVVGDTELTLTAVANDTVAADAVAVKNGTNKYTLTFKGLDSSCKIKLAIDGEQTATDVFLFEPLNGRDMSQTMAGFNSSTLPVHAELEIADDAEYYYTNGKLKVTKEVELDGIHYDNNKTYYVTVFEDEALTVPVETKAINMDGKSVNYVEFDNLAIGYTYYVAETDADGNVVDAEAVGAAEIKVDENKVVIGKVKDESAETEEVTITNCYDDEEYFAEEDDDQMTDEEEDLNKSESSTEESEESTQTGDDSNMAGYIALMAAALAAMGVAVFRRRKN